LIETAIHVLIGFLTAALLGMMAIPAISRRASRLAEARARLLAPLSSSQAQADLDALRGRQAIEILAAERRIEAAEQATRQAQIELGQRARDIVDRETHIAEKSAEITRQRSEIASALIELRNRDVEIASRELVLFDLTRQRDASARKWADAQSTIDEQQRDLEQSGSEIASLKTRTAELAGELIEQERKFEEISALASNKIADLTNTLVATRAVASRLESQVFDIETRHSALRNEAEGRAAELQRTRQRIGDLEPRLAESEKLRDELAAENSRQMTRASEKEAELLRLRSAHREEIERFQDRLSGAAARENELTMRVQALIAARGDAERAMRGAASERDRLAKECTGLRERLAAAEAATNSLTKGDAALRLSIVRLGHAFTIQGPEERGNANMDSPSSRRLRELAGSALEGEGVDRRPSNLTSSL
jgi:chromosome segregation ATPase